MRQNWDQYTPWCLQDFWILFLLCFLLVNHSSHQKLVQAPVSCLTLTLWIITYLCGKSCEDGEELKIGVRDFRILTRKRIWMVHPNQQLAKVFLKGRKYQTKTSLAEYLCNPLQRFVILTAQRRRWKDFKKSGKDDKQVYHIQKLEPNLHENCCLLVAIIKESRLPPPQAGKLWVLW